MDLFFDWPAWVQAAVIVADVLAIGLYALIACEESA